MSQTLKLYIPKVLSENKTVLLKGIGTLRMNYRPAEIDKDGGCIDAPRDEIYFVPTNERKLDPVLIRIVEIIARVDEDEAADLVENFMNDLQHELGVNGFLTFPNIGWIKQDHWGSLFFEPAAEYISINKYFGFGKVDLPEALSVAEQEVIADLKETVSERAEQDNLVTAGDRDRSWGFIIGGGLIILLLLGLTFFVEGTGDTMATISSMNPTGEKILASSSQPNSTADNRGPQVTMTDTLSVADTQLQKLETLDVNTKSGQLDASTGCVIIVGAFQNEDNVEKMVDRLEETNYRSVVIAGSRLTKVGLHYECSEDPGSALAWAQEHIDQDAWIYKTD